VAGGVISFLLGRWAGKKWGKSEESPRNWGAALAGASVIGAALKNKSSTGEYFPSSETIAAYMAGAPMAMPQAQVLPTAAPEPVVLPGATAGPVAINGGPVTPAEMPVIPPKPGELDEFPGDPLGPLREAIDSVLRAAEEFGGELPEDQLVRHQTKLEEVVAPVKATAAEAGADLISQAEAMIADIASRLDADEGTGWY
jgi:hypothetical protein